MKVNIKVQRHLVTAWDAKDNGEFVFIICRRGIEGALEQRLKTGKKYAINVDAQMIEEINPDEPPVIGDSLEP